MASKQKEIFTKIQDQLAGNLDPEELQKFYEKWHDTYDQDKDTIGYAGAKLGAEFLNKHLPSGVKDLPILDVAAGTGKAAQHLRQKYGYTVIDALDSSMDMLNVAKKKNLYRNYICTMIVSGEQTNIADDTYGAVVVTAGFANDHLKCDAMEELIRIVRPGGLIVNAMREEYTRLHDEFVKLRPLCKDLEKAGKWRCLEETVPETKFYMDRDALVQVYQVL